MQPYDSNNLGKGHTESIFRLKIGKVALILLSF